MADWVELRVHGVSGTPPEDMLDSPHVGQVAGDERSRCFRPLDAHNDPVLGSEGQVLEAFHWGRWTSGSWSQALWMLLIPFGIVNAAQFMLPAPLGWWSRAAHAVSGAALRLLALVLTLAFTAGAAVIVVDLGAWQWLLRRSFPVDDRVVLVAALFVAGTVGYTLSLLGRAKKRSHARFQTAATAMSTAQPPAPEPAEGDPPPTRPFVLADLGTPAFFDGDPDSPALRNLHRAAGLTLVAFLGMEVAAQSHNAWTTHVQWLPVWLLGVVAAVVLLLGDPEESATVAGTGNKGGVRAAPRKLREWWHGTAGGASGASHWAALGLLVAAGASDLLAVVAVATTEPGRRLGLPPVTGTLPGMDGAAAWVGIAGTAVVVLLLLAVGLLAVFTRSGAEPIKEFRRFAGGMTAALAAAVGFFLAIGFTAGFSLFAQGLLNRFRTNYPDAILALLPPDAPERIPAVKAPAVLQRVSYAWGITAVLVLLLVIAALVWLGVRRNRFRQQAAAAMTFGNVPGPRIPQRWQERVGRAMQIARFKNQLVPVFWYFAIAGTVLSIAATAGYLSRRGFTGWPNRWPDAWTLLTGAASPPGGRFTLADLLVGIGSTTLVALGTALVTITRGALGSEGTRRSLNVVWDVIAFWPRSVHPYVPEPYSEDVVPALVRRICWHLGASAPFPLPDGSSGAPGEPNPAPAERVVVAAHSQGSLIALAALLWLPPDLRKRVRWLTFGSQLRQQFPRAFPHYVYVALLGEMQQRHRWLSLYRDTDPIAGPVGSWDHTPDGKPETRDGETGQWSRRLPAPLARGLDEIQPTTGRRECGREWRLLDPAPGDPALQAVVVASIHGHGSYWANRQDWSDALRDVLGEDVPGDGGGGDGVGQAGPVAPDLSGVVPTQQQPHAEPGEQPVSGESG